MGGGGGGWRKAAAGGQTIGGLGRGGVTPDVLISETGRIHVWLTRITSDDNDCIGRDVSLNTA